MFTGKIKRLQLTNNNFYHNVSNIMKDFNPSKFLKEVKQEGQKIVWPTRKETLITTAMVFVMVLIFSLFFLLVDNIISWLIRLILGI